MVWSCVAAREPERAAAKAWGMQGGEAVRAAWGRGIPLSFRHASRRPQSVRFGAGCGPAVRSVLRCVHKSAAGSACERLANRFSVHMAGPEGEVTGKGKGKSRGGSTAGPDRRGENTPPLDQEGSRTLAAGAASGTARSRSKVIALSARLCLGDTSMEEMEAPRRKTVCVFAFFVAVLALLRNFLLPVSSKCPIIHGCTKSRLDVVVVCTVGCWNNSSCAAYHAGTIYDTPVLVQQSVAATTDTARKRERDRERGSASTTTALLCGTTGGTAVVLSRAYICV